ncbi:putative transfer protein SpdA [[Actinomadura] parvosata subsp. kistnae]|uniref:hypothetical protein n=1 Tax=[Actinomadura] parvosata TaxID=1955412 RepID=UPI000D2CB771|nr:hypothetical protein [Nonomuraea sp. ATCC 55076]SPL94156.1 putative transfer protein SpdA [Actinomadura parvosata subsp. kistnae]
MSAGPTSAGHTSAGHTSAGHTSAGRTSAGRTDTEKNAQAPYDPLRLCIYATVALLAWLLGPWAVLGFAALGFAGYWRARRAGLTRSKCFLRDTRLVLAYLGLIALAAVAAIIL